MGFTFAKPRGKSNASTCPITRGEFIEAAQADMLEATITFELAGQKVVFKASPREFSPGDKADKGNLGWYATHADSDDPTIELPTGHVVSLSAGLRLSVVGSSVRKDEALPGVTPEMIAAFLKQFPTK